MPNRSTEMGLELKKTFWAIPYHTLTSKNDFRAVLSPLFKILEKFTKTIDKSKTKCYNSLVFKIRKDEKNEKVFR